MIMIMIIVIIIMIMAYTAAFPQRLFICWNPNY